MNIFILERLIMLIKEIIGVDDARTRDEPPCDGVVRVLPLGVQAAGHVAEQGTYLHSTGIDPATEITLRNQADPGHEDSQGGITNAVLTDIVEVATATEPTRVLFF
ncbi:MAG: hypothetical protein OXF41_04800 [bacterium]|nr:hypothetical protein [bacterium]